MFSDPFWTAVTFLMIGIVLVVAEVWFPGYFIAVPGGALFLMGAIGIVQEDLMFNSTWSWFLWPAAAVVATTANLYFYKRWAPPGTAPLTMGSDSLPGETGTVVKEILPGTPGQIRIRGGVWSARTDGGALPEGAKARVVRVDGVYVVVEPVAG